MSEWTDQKGNGVRYHAEFSSPDWSYRATITKFGDNHRWDWELWDGKSRAGISRGTVAISTPTGAVELERAKDAVDRARYRHGVLFSAVVAAMTWRLMGRDR